MQVPPDQWEKEREGDTGGGRLDDVWGLLWLLHWEGAPGIEGVGAREAAPHPMAPGMAPNVESGHSFLPQEPNPRTSLAVQRLRLCSSKAGGTGSILHATWHGKKKKPHKKHKNNQP